MRGHLAVPEARGIANVGFDLRDGPVLDDAAGHVQIRAHVAALTVDRVARDALAAEDLEALPRGRGAWDGGRHDVGILLLELDDLELRDLPRPGVGAPVALRGLRPDEIERPRIDAPGTERRPAEVAAVRQIGIPERQKRPILGEPRRARRLVVPVPGTDEDVRAAERIGRRAEPEAQHVGERTGDVAFRRAVVRVDDVDRRRRACRHDGGDVGLFDQRPFAREADFRRVGEKREQKGERYPAEPHGAGLCSEIGAPPSRRSEDTCGRQFRQARSRGVPPPRAASRLRC